MRGGAGFFHLSCVLSTHDCLCICLHLFFVFVFVFVFVIVVVSVFDYDDTLPLDDGRLSSVIEKEGFLELCRVLSTHGQK